jgi:hypothetical protein
VARLFADENFPGPVVEELRALGHDVVTIQGIGRASESVPDDEVLAIAVSDGRAVLTLNRRHFRRLHVQVPAHAGIVVCKSDTDFLAMAARIHLAVVSAGNLRGQLLRVNRPG